MSLENKSDNNGLPS